MYKFFQKGFSLAEAVVAVSLCLVVLLSLFGVWTMVLSYSLSGTARVQATYLLEEGVEVMRILRDDGWSTNIAPINSEEDFYLEFDGSSWNISDTNQFVDAIFERKVVLADTYRDENDSITLSGGTLDTNTKKVTVSVAWFSKGATTTRELSTYLTNVFSN
jgi:hypothetical protein